MLYMWLIFSTNLVIINFHVFQQYLSFSAVPSELIENASYISPMTNHQYNNIYNTMNQPLAHLTQPSVQYDAHGRPVTHLLNSYLVQEGIDRRYSQLILQELYDATQLNNEQLNMAANELISNSTTSRNNSYNRTNPNV